LTPPAFLPTLPPMKFPLPVLVALLTTLPLAAETVTLNPVADTAMMSLSPDNNFGRLPHIPAGALANNPGEVARALFRFDVAAAVPAGAVITAVSLRVQVSKEAIGGTADTAGLHRLLVDWAEGTKTALTLGSAATPGDSNWIWREMPNTQWGAPGGQAGVDFTAAASSSVVWDGVGAYTFPSSPALVADVQAWMDNPAANHGWLVKSAAETGRTAKRIVSRESPVASQRPQLTIEFTLPPAAAPLISSMKLTGADAELMFRIEAGNLYELRAYDAPGAATFQVRTNYASKFESFDAVFTEPADQASRFYQLVITGQID